MNLYLKRLVPTILYVLLTAVCGCDSPVEKEEEPTKQCFSIIDTLTQVPIEGARVVLNAFPPYHDPINFSGTTDFTGVWGTTFDKNTMKEMHEHMFGGVSGVDEYGNIIQPVASVSIGQFNREDSWTTVTQYNPDYLYFPETRKAVYTVNFSFLGNGGHIFTANENVAFYVQPVVDEGIEKFLLRGIKGLSALSVKGTEDIPYDGFLQLYR